MNIVFITVAGKRAWSNHRPALDCALVQDWHAGGQFRAASEAER
jgi:hypothetical protein